MRKTLIYYIYYSGENSFYLEKNLQLINRYIFIFDKVICKVATDSPDTDTSFIKIPHTKVQNNPETGERDHFMQSLKEVDPNSICFYAHAKGVSKDRTNALDNWVASLYFFNLDERYRNNAMNEIYAGKSFSGILGKLIQIDPVESPWHYSGTFFWFNPKSIPSDIKLPDNRWAIEALPGLCTSAENAHFQFYSSKNPYYLYKNEIWSQILKSVDRKYLMYFNDFFSAKTVTAKPIFKPEIKKVIYTCLFGKYDNLNPAPVYKGWDTVLFTDAIPENARGWEVRLVQNELSPEKESRRYKFLSHIYLSNYNLVCHIDANMQLIKEHLNTPLWFKHPVRSNVFDEAKRIVELEKDSEETVKAQMRFYIENKYKNYPLMENGFFIRRHSKEMNLIMDRAWEIIKRFSYRDQLALPFVCSQSRYTVEGFDNVNRSALFWKKRAHAKKLIFETKVNVHHITPARSDKNFGHAINQLIENLPENDWICLRDIDTVPAYHEKFIEQCERIANDPKGFALIGCMTNRLGLGYQLVDGMFDNWDIQQHRKVAKELSANTNIKPLLRGQTVGGLMMLFSKATWRKAGKFPEGGIVLKGKFIDWYFSDAVSKFGTMGIAEGIYLIHLYRIEAKDTRTEKRHLI